MMKKTATGVVMEINGAGTIIMTKDGEFLKVKKPSLNVEIGQEITSTILKSGNNISFIRYVSIAAAILIMLLPFTYFREAYATVAYVNVDINPSLEMGINKYNKVNEIIPLNEDAKILLHDLSLKNCDIEEALHMVITGAKDKGFIKEDKINNIDITLVNVKEKKVNISPDILVEYAEKEVSEIHVDASIKINKANKDVHDEAKKENMSTNKYLDKNESSRKDSIKIEIKKDDPSKTKDKDKKKDEEKSNAPDNSSKDNKDKDGKKNVPGNSKSESPNKDGKQNNAWSDNSGKGQGNSENNQSDNNGNPGNGNKNK